ncbi:AAA family ATPase [Aerosakkonema sp. BLCC-F183]|uniref:trifunctional serine/threonine-protein kinase/ATP-binding protein/sensor histidine kinase n=1 Tax=Aerosakkonema sp. BLCC-F183 TaxID=3342834 RepID=UPI0035BB68A6
MIKLIGYDISALIYESTNSLVYRGRRSRDNLPVILKVLKQDYPTPQELTRYKQEYEITSNLDLEGVIKAYDLQQYQNTLVMILEDFGGESLKILMSHREFTLSDFFVIAIQVVDILGQIHQQNIIHKDINPSNIVFNPETQKVKIIDFGISTVLTREQLTLKNPNLLEGTLAYMSPEQTGRMNRSLDYRTDFYSLGATFYELLTNKLPFEAIDLMELVHCHIAKQPNEVKSQNSKIKSEEIPQVISDIVMKLMAKNAEDRYQSAWGIKADLEKCLWQLETGNLAEFPLGTEDISDKFQIPQKLYGREREIETLLAAFDRVSQGEIEMMLVSGYSGIGKSALVQEIYKPITQQRGYFISGKFDQLQRNTPYSAVIKAFQELVGQLLTETETQLDSWRKKLSAALGQQGKVIVDVIPEIELIIGPQPPVAELGPSESQNRFNLVFQNFIRVFSQLQHPFVIFLDDLQWADSATLKLIESIVTDTYTHSLFLIGAYRDNEVDPTHPLMITLDRLRSQSEPGKEGVIINEISLFPLNIIHITELIADTLHAERKSIAQFAELVLRKTEGNPFFINQFLNTLYEEKLLVFDLDRKIWQWDIAQIEAMGITDNVVELMTAKLKKLPESTQQVLRLAACVGNEFDLKTLSIIYEKSEAETFTELLPAIQEELIVATSELQATTEEKAIDSHLVILNYKFLHDRVQQAAYILINEKQKKATHLRIGRLLLAKVTSKERSERIFELIDHLNAGRELITAKPEKIALAKLNLEAGKKAKQATAYISAIGYLKAGMEALTDNSWKSQYKLTLDLHTERAEVEYLTGSFAYSTSLINLILSKARSAIEKAEIYNLLIVQHTLNGQYQEAIQAGRKALLLLGIELANSDFQAALFTEINEAKLNLQDRKIASLLDANIMEIPEKILALKVLSTLIAPTSVSDRDIYPLVALKIVNISLKYGNQPESSFGYSSYGLILSCFLGDYESGYDFALLALKLSQKFNSLAYKCKACFMLSECFNHWFNHTKEAQVICHEGYQAGLECGDLQFAGYILASKTFHMFYQGKNLKQIVPEAANHLVFLQKTNNYLSSDLILGLEISIFNLIGLAGEKFVFASGRISEKPYVDNCHTNNSMGAICLYYILKLQILYLYGQYSEALKYSLLSEKTIYFIFTHISVAARNFYLSLTLVALYPEATESEQKQYDEQLSENQKRMKTWADRCPENFLNMYFLVEAEIARIYGKYLEAIDLYDRAIQSAHENGFIQNEALANELAAKFWLSQGKEKYAKTHMTEAYYGYQHWGANRKVQDLEEKYPHLIATIQKGLQMTAVLNSVTYTSSGSDATLLDLDTVMKASQAISGEIVLAKLLASLMKILIENAGAQKGFLILIRDGKLLIEASFSVDEEEVIVQQSTPIESSQNLPLTVINYVERTRSDVVLSNAATEEKFTADRYIAEQQLKSVLCTPILNQGKLIGILYLENNLTFGAFTPDRLKVLRLLSSQAAISLENARLYASVEQKVAERTQQLNEKNIHLEQMLHELKRTQSQLIQNEKMSSLGQMVAGVAHEINNPINFIYGNVDYASNYVRDLLNLIDVYRQEYPHPTPLVQKTNEDIELEFLVEDLQKILDSMKVGAERIRNIVLSLRNFSRHDESDMKLVDIHSGIDSTLVILQHRLSQAKFNIEVIKEYDRLPKISCFASNLNQVFMNILSNAIDALESRFAIDTLSEGKNKSQLERLPVLQPGEKDRGAVEDFLTLNLKSSLAKVDIVTGTAKTPTSRQIENPQVRIRTEVKDSDRVLIRIADNGPGMSEDVQKRIFDPFFTTKPVGSGTGLGLTVCYEIVVQKHGGKLTCVSAPGKGTEFIVEIPIQPKD